MNDCYAARLGIYFYVNDAFQTEQGVGQGARMSHPGRSRDINIIFPHQYGAKKARPVCKRPSSQRLGVLQCAGHSPISLDETAGILQRPTKLRALR